MKTYTVQYPVKLEVEVEECFIGLMMIESADPKKPVMVDGEGNELECWDAVVEFKEGQIEITGNDGPGGGRVEQVQIIVPMTLLASYNADFR